MKTLPPHKNITRYCCVIASATMLCLGAKADVTSTFTTDLDGWTLANNDPSSTLTYQSAGGNPGGYALFSDGAQGANDVFNAPAKFLGNDSLSYNQPFSFDLLTNATADSLGNLLVIAATSGDTLSLMLTAPTVNAWTSYSFMLNPSGGFAFDNGAPATQAQIQAVLANVASIHIPADLVNGASTLGLDNVRLGVAVPEPATWTLLVVAAALLFALRRSRQALS